MCSGTAFGEVKFSLSCKYDAQKTFDLALSLLHSFEYAEAEKAFVQVIDMDPDCAMAYWGVSMSIFQSLWMQADRSYLKKGEQLLAIAQKLPTSNLEKEYLEAISAFYTDYDEVDQKTRKLRYEEKMEALYLNHKGDTEATVFYALAILAAADPGDKTYARQKKSGAILEALFADNPNHPGIAHYIIHNYDYPELAGKALSTARRYAEIAPASAHAQHMPSHIFTRLGLWEESIRSNINSETSAECYGENINPDATWAQELHAIDYLVYACLQLGDNRKAKEYALEVKSITSVFPEQHIGATYALTAIPVRIALENKAWGEATQLELPTIDFSWEELQWESAMVHFGRALGFVHTGDTEAAAEEVNTLDSLHLSLMAANETYKAEQVNVQLHAARAWVAFAQRNTTDALTLMHQAVDLEKQTSKHPVTPGEVLPADELLGDLLLSLGNPVAAFAAYKTSLKDNPNRFNGLYGAATAARRMGDGTTARKYYGLLVSQVGSVDSDRPELREARRFVGGS